MKNWKQWKLKEEFWRRVPRISGSVSQSKRSSTKTENISLLPRNVFPNNRPEPSTPNRKKKTRNESPVHSPSPVAVRSSPTPWQPSPPCFPQEHGTPLLVDPKMRLFCLQSPCDNQEDLDDTGQRLSMYFGKRVYTQPNDIPGNFQRRRTWTTIYQRIVIAKGRDVYARCLPPCARAAAQAVFPTEESLTLEMLQSNSAVVFP